MSFEQLVATLAAPTRRRALNVGDVRHRLTLMARTKNIYNNTCWVCECSCGKTVTVRAEQIHNEQSKSCGCLRVEATRARRIITHKEHNIVRNPVTGQYTKEEHA